ncbi:MAG: GlcNAc-PI de-N-acetylase [Gammaproteobacteria bacterium]|nr:GlcNAc-PI de-N-acetylase [Gammaproteobacteria bacterium]|tara:strand:- start:1707 stop:2375 length:669 start_codon:yes stop_codon:yes gene_type:complete
MRKVLVVAPHADDETLGCGGTLLKHFDGGDEIYWLLVTDMSLESGFLQTQIEARELEISKIIELYGFKETYRLGFPPAALEAVPMKDIIQAISSVVDKLHPEIIYSVFRNDVHSDHSIVSDAVMAATKSFRYPSVKRVLAFETLSETEFSLRVDGEHFRPNVFVNIEKYLTQKIEIMEQFKSEMGEFPFPRSAQAIQALAKYRGVQAGCESAEAFMLLKEIR